MEEFLLALPQMAKVKHRSVFPSALRKRPPDTFSQKGGHCASTDSVDLSPYVGGIVFALLTAISMYAL
mgnify:CR=1 FL=1